MQTIRYNKKRQGDIEALASNHKGNGFAHILTRTVPAMNKTNNPFFGNILKITDSQVQWGFYYLNSVNNQLEREGKPRNAELKNRQWGTRIEGTPLVEHTNKKGEHRLYLEVKIERVNSVKYITVDTGEEIEKDTLAPWIKERRKSSTQSELTKEIFLRDYALDSILWMRADGVEIDCRKPEKVKATV